MAQLGCHQPPGRTGTDPGGPLARRRAHTCLPPAADAPARRPGPARPPAAGCAAAAHGEAGAARVVEGDVEGDTGGGITAQQRGGLVMRARLPQGSSVTQRGHVDLIRADPGPASRQQRPAPRVRQHRAGGQVPDPLGPGEFTHAVRLALAAGGTGDNPLYQPSPRSFSNSPTFIRSILNAHGLARSSTLKVLRASPQRTLAVVGSVGDWHSPPPRASPRPVTAALMTC